MFKHGLEGGLGTGYTFMTLKRLRVETMFLFPLTG